MCRPSERNSIYFSLFRLLAVSAVLSGILFVIVNTVTGYYIDTYYSNPKYVEQKNKEYIAKLQEHVIAYKLTAKNLKELTTWVKKQKILSIQLYRNKILIYDSDYPNEENLEPENTDTSSFSRKQYYPVTFSDGQAQVHINGMYDYRIYTYSFIIELILTFVVFLMLVLMGIRKKMHYIRQLSDEIGILEGGNLEYEITVTGKDELAALASGLDSMRKSFCEQVKLEANLVQENQKIITEMSHDLRTPLTAIMLYIEILKKGGYKEEKQLIEYLDKIDRIAHRMKQQTDNLFEYSLIAENTELLSETTESYEVVFYDLISETCNYLEQNGFKTELSGGWSNERIEVNLDYISRIMDNITSNIIKYADTEQSIRISNLFSENMLGISFENHIKEIRENGDSTGIGIQSIKNMMWKMNGTCISEQTDALYKIILMFPCASA